MRLFCLLLLGLVGVYAPDARALNVPPENFPSFELTNQEDKTVQLKDFEGKRVLLTFFFTRCPMPNMCPLLSHKVAQIQERIPEESKNQIALLSVSFDPEYDTPEVLKEYGLQYGADFSNWHFLTGPKEIIDRMTENANLFYEKTNEGFFGHNIRTLVLGEKGQVLKAFNGTGWQVEAVLDALLK